MKIKITIFIFLCVIMFLSGCFSTSTRYSYSGVELTIEYERFDYNFDFILEIFNNATIPYNMKSENHLAINAMMVFPDNSDYSNMEVYVSYNQEIKRLYFEIYYSSPNATTKHISKTKEKNDWIEKVNTYYDYDKSLVDALANIIIDVIDENTSEGRGEWSYKEKYSVEE